MPVRLDVCGLLPALSCTLNCPVLFPVCVGVNVTLILQFFLAPKLAVRVVFDTAKSPVAETAMLFSDNAANSPQIVALSGTGVEPATLTPASATYATQRVGTTTLPCR